MADTRDGRFRDLTIDTFVERLGSAEPAPGGGAASAVAAALGASLVAMVAGLSMDRPKYAAHAGLHREARATAEALSRRFLDLADADAAAYAAFAAARRLPHEGEAAAAARAATMHAAARRAAEVPLECVEACLDLVTLTEALAGRSNLNASSDLNVAALLGEGAARGAAANVLVNLPSVDDAAWTGTTTARVDELLHEIGRLAELTRAQVLAGELREPIAPEAASAADAP